MSSKHTIILTEDSFEDAMIIKEIFNASDLPFDLVHFSNGVELMDFLKGQNDFINDDGTPKFLVVLDIYMPLKDGIECLREIRSSDHGQLKDVPIVIFSGSKSDELNDQLRALGANSFIPKPNNVKEVRQMFDGLAANIA